MMFPLSTQFGHLNLRSVRVTGSWSASTLDMLRPIAMGLPRPLREIPSGTHLVSRPTTHRRSLVVAGSPSKHLYLATNIVSTTESDSRRALPQPGPVSVSRVRDLC